MTLKGPAVASNFISQYREYIRKNRQSARRFGFDFRKMATVEPLLKFLYKDWWRVQIAGLKHLPKEGTAVLVGNFSGLAPWAALMLMYAVMSNSENPRRVSVLVDLDWIEDERMRSYLTKIGFVPWSSANMKQLFANGELVAIFPEGASAMGKPFSERNRVREFDWTKLLPAIEEGVDIYPVAIFGCDDSNATFFNFDKLSKFLSMPSFPVSAFFPWLPFPFNMAALPVRWSMAVMKATSYDRHSNRDTLEDNAKRHARFVEGEVQAELNRIFRSRTKSYI